MSHHGDSSGQPGTRILGARWYLYTGFVVLLLVVAAYLFIKYYLPSVEGALRADAFYLLGLVFAGVIVVVLLVLVPRLQVAHLSRDKTAEHRIQLEDKARATLAQGLLAVFFLVTAYSTWQSLQATRDGQVTEMYVKAIELLGTVHSAGDTMVASPSLMGHADLPIVAKRLGGIYALERIAWHSKRDHWPIMEVLATCLRMGRPLSTAGEGKAQAVPLPEDAQAILTVLARRNPAMPEYENLDLAKIDLQGADFHGGNFAVRKSPKGEETWTVLAGSNLTGAHLEDTELAEADLTEANLTGANLTEARLIGAKLRGAILAEADLEAADLTGANLRGATLAEADLKAADLTGADLRETDATVEQLKSAKSIKNAKLSAGMAPPQ